MNVKRACIILKGFDEEEIMQPEPSKTPREMLELLASYDEQQGLDYLLNQFNWSKTTRHQIYYTVLARLPETASAAIASLNYDAKDHFIKTLQCREFRQNIIKFILNSFPEKERYLFIHIPKCAGSDLTLNLMKKHPFLDQHLQEESWISNGQLIGELTKVISKIIHSNTIFVARHIKLGWYMDNSLCRFGDRIFTIIRHPYEIALSQVNYIITRFLDNPSFSDPDTAEWAQYLALDSFDQNMPADQLREFALRILHSPDLVSGQTLCSYLGRGDAQSAVELLARCNAEITDISRYNDWLRKFWKIDSSTRHNASTPILKIQDLDSEQLRYLSEISAEDIRLYEHITSRLERSGECRVFGVDLC